MNHRSLTDSRLILGQPEPRRVRERRQRRADILSAAEAVFAAKGYHAASVEQIASAAEYASGTVYLYFRDKDALYRELFEEKIRQLSRLIQQRTRGIKDPIEALRLSVGARMEFFEMNRAFFRIYAREGINQLESRQAHWSEVRRLYAEYLRRLARYIRKGQKLGILRGGDPQQLAVALSGMMIQLTRHQLQQRTTGPLTDLAPFVLDTYLNGITADAGSKAERQFNQSQRRKPRNAR